MNKIKFGILILAFTLFAPTTSTSAVVQEVYLVPEQCNAPYRNKAEVEIWINASTFYGGKINLAYNAACANVTNWVRNTDVFALGGWTHYDGIEWITFSLMPPAAILSGNYMIGTFTLHCGGASRMHAKTPASPIISTTKTPDLIKTQTPTITHPPIATASPLASPSPAPTMSPEGKRELPGFEAVFAISVQDLLQ